MIQLTTQDIQALIAFAITNNKQGLIAAMNATGNTVAMNITDDALLQRTLNVFTTKGLDGIRNILSRVTVDKSKVTQKQKDIITQKFQINTSNAKFSDWFNSAVITAEDILGGHTTITSAPIISETKSPISTTTMIIFAIAAIITIVIILFSFRKYF